jgi:hypothetical protein
MSSLKRVRFNPPQVVNVYDFYVRLKFVIPYNPYLRLISLPRFNGKRFKDLKWLVYSKELKQEISIYIPLGEQGVLAGDTLEVVAE